MKRTLILVPLLWACSHASPIVDSDGGSPGTGDAGGSSGDGGIASGADLSDNIADGAIVSDMAIHGDGAISQVSGDCLADNWCWQRPTPFGASLFGVWGSSVSDVWAAASGGVVAHYDGASWTLYRPGVDQDLLAVWGTSASNAWAVGAGGTILHWDGVSWSNAASPTTHSLHAVSGSGPSDLWAVGDEDTRLHFDGQSWMQAPSVFTFGAPNLVSIYCAASDDVWVVSDYESGEFLHLHGGTWDVVDPGVGDPQTGYATIWGASGSDIWAGGRSGTIHYDGSHWSAAASGAPNQSVAIAGTVASDVLIVGDWGSTTEVWNGAQFVNVPEVNDEYLTGAWLSPSGEGWLVGYAGRMAHKLPGGAWSFVAGQSEGGYDTLSDIAILSDNDAWVVGRLSIGHWDGTTWSDIPPANTAARQEFNNVWAANQSDVWATSWGSSSPDNLQRWNGTEWTTMPHPGPSYLNDVWGSGPNDVWVIFDEGSMHYTGTSWTLQGMVGNYAVGGHSIDGTAQNDAWIVADGGTVYHYNGSAWSVVSSGTTQNLWSIHAVSSSLAFAGGENATLLKWNGTNWQSMSAPTVRGDQNGNRVIISITGSANDLWVTASSGDVFHYDGSAWTKSASLGVPLGTIARAPSGGLFTVGGNGSIFFRAP